MSVPFTSLYKYNRKCRMHPCRVVLHPHMRAIPCWSSETQLLGFTCIVQQAHSLRQPGCPKRAFTFRGGPAHDVMSARAHRSSSAENSRVCHRAWLASELAPERHDVRLGARQFPLQHVHPSCWHQPACANSPCQPRAQTCCCNLIRYGEACRPVTSACAFASCEPLIVSHPCQA